MLCPRMANFLGRSAPVASASASASADAAHWEALPGGPSDRARPKGREAPVSRAGGTGPRAEKAEAGAGAGSQGASAAAAMATASIGAGGGARRDLVDIVNWHGRMRFGCSRSVPVCANVPIVFSDGRRILLILIFEMTEHGGMYPGFLACTRVACPSPKDIVRILSYTVHTYES